MTAGRPPILTPDDCAEICHLVADGHSVRAVARLIGRDVKTIRRHAARSPRFARQLATAQIDARRDPLKIMRRAAATSWRAAAWLLERTEPHRYAKQPPACRREQVDRAFTRIMDGALSCVSGDEHRIALYHCLATIMKEEMAELFAPPSARSPHAPPDRRLDPHANDLLDLYSNPLPRLDADPVSANKVPAAPLDGPQIPPPKTSPPPVENAHPPGQPNHLGTAPPMRHADLIPKIPKLPSRSC